MQFPFITYGMTLYKRQYTDKALLLRNIYVQPPTPNLPVIN